MSKITTFSPAVCKALDARVKAALAPLAAEFGVEFRIGGGSYLGGSYKPRFEVAVVGDNGLAMTPEAEAFRRYAPTLGLKPEDLGRSFTSSGGRVMTIIGYRARAVRHPIMAKTEDGKTYVFPLEDVRRLLAAQPVKEA